MFTQSLKQTACSLLLLSGALVTSQQVGAATTESRTVMLFNDETVVVTRNQHQLQITTSDNLFFSAGMQQDNKKLLVSINGWRQTYPIDLLQHGRIRFSDEYLAEYKVLYESELGDLLGIPENPDELFDVSGGEAIGCAAGGIIIGAVSAWAGGIVAGACLAYFDDHSIETD